MNAIDQYINAVLHNLTVHPEDRQRIEADLRAHLEEASQADEPLQAVLDRMGSPEEVANAFMAQIELDYASFGRRMVAFIIDTALLLLALLVFGVIVLALNNLIPAHPESPLNYAFGALIILVMISASLSAMSIFLLYYPLLEGRFGQTIGKKLLELRVLNESGLHIGYKQAFLRRISFYFDIFPFDALFVLFTEKRQRGFDIIARTIVVVEH